MAAKLVNQAFTRAEVRRALSISERQLRAWERNKLIPASNSFAFSDLIALRTLHLLHKNRVPTARIRRAMDAIREKLRGVSNPLSEVKVFAHGKRIGVQVEGRKMEAITGQLLLDFDNAQTRLVAFPKTAAKAQSQPEHARKAEAERWFQRGIDLEQTGAPIEEIVEAYRQAIDSDPKSAGALVNLGTLHFNMRAWKQAEMYYRKALEVDNTYPLAHFNLGNLYDERGDRKRALMHYLAAIKHNPRYADAHYNIALLYQLTGQTLKAVHHWRLYLKLDPSSSWAAIARQELEKLRKATVVHGSRRPPTEPASGG